MTLTIEQRAWTAVHPDRPPEPTDTHRPDLRGPDAATVFTAVYDRHAPTILRYLRGHLRSSDAEDVLAETFCAAWDARERYDPDRAVCSAWLFGIAVHLLSRHKRSWIRGRRADDRLQSRSETVHAGHEDRVVEKVTADAATRQLTDALARLHDRDREALLLASTGDLSTADIARITDVPVGTVRSRLHRARQQLRDQPALTALLDTSGDLS